MAEAMVPLFSKEENGQPWELLSSREVSVPLWLLIIEIGLEESFIELTLILLEFSARTSHLPIAISLSLPPFAGASLQFATVRFVASLFAEFLSCWSKTIFHPDKSLGFEHFCEVRLAMPLLEARIELRLRFRELRGEVGLEPEFLVKLGVNLELGIKVGQGLKINVNFLLAPLLSTFAFTNCSPLVFKAHLLK
jgi:hypothetical protein